MAKPAPEQGELLEQAQRIARLEALNADLREDALEQRRRLQRTVEAAATLEARATTAEETVGVMREHARTLWEAVYRGETTRAADILRALEGTTHA